MSYSDAANELAVRRFAEDPHIPQVVTLDLSTYWGRFGVRAYAYGLIAAGEEGMGQRILGLLDRADRKLQ